MHLDSMPPLCCPIGPTLYPSAHPTPTSLLLATLDGPSGSWAQHPAYVGGLPATRVQWVSRIRNRVSSSCSVSSQGVVLRLVTLCLFCSQKAEERKYRRNRLFLSNDMLVAHSPFTHMPLAGMSSSGECGKCSLNCCPASSKNGVKGTGACHTVPLGVPGQAWWMHSFSE